MSGNRCETELTGSEDCQGQWAELLVCGVVREGTAAALG